MKFLSTIKSTLNTQIDTLKTASKTAALAAGLFFALGGDVAYAADEPKDLKKGPTEDAKQLEQLKQFFALRDTYTTTFQRKALQLSKQKDLTDDAKLLIQKIQSFEKKILQDSPFNWTGSIKELNQEYQELLNSYEILVHKNSFKKIQEQANNVEQTSSFTSLQANQLVETFGCDLGECETQEYSLQLLDLQDHKTIIQGEFNKEKMNIESLVDSEIDAQTLTAPLEKFSEISCKYEELLGEEAALKTKYIEAMQGLFKEKEQTYARQEDANAVSESFKARFQKELEVVCKVLTQQEIDEFTSQAAMLCLQHRLALVKTDLSVQEQQQRISTVLDGYIQLSKQLHSIPAVVKSAELQAIKKAKQADHFYDQLGIRRKTFTRLQPSCYINGTQTLCAQTHSEEMRKFGLDGAIHPDLSLPSDDSHILRSMYNFPKPGSQITKNPAFLKSTLTKDLRDYNATTEENTITIEKITDEAKSIGANSLILAIYTPGNRFGHMAQAFLDETTNEYMVLDKYVRNAPLTLVQYHRKIRSKRNGLLQSVTAMRVPHSYQSPTTYVQH